MINTKWNLISKDNANKRWKNVAKEKCGTRIDARKSALVEKLYSKIDRRNKKQMLFWGAGVVYRPVGCIYPNFSTIKSAAQNSIYWYLQNKSFQKFFSHFWISQELVALLLCDFVTNQWKPYYTNFTRKSPVCLLSEQWDTIEFPSDVLRDYIYCLSSSPTISRWMTFRPECNQLLMILYVTSCLWCFSIFFTMHIFLQSLIKL